MKEDIKEVLEQFKYGNYSIEQATNELFDLYNVRQRSEPLEKRPTKAYGHTLECRCPDCLLIERIFDNGG